MRKFSFDRARQSFVRSQDKTAPAWRPGPPCGQRRDDLDLFGTGSPNAARPV